MNWLERTIETVSPGWSSRRDTARLRSKVTRSQMEALSTYEAADKSRLTNDWPSQNKTADQAILPDYPTLVARGRGAVRDNWIAESIVSGYLRHVVGSGITARAKARDPITGEPLVEYNKILDRKWLRWATRKNLCDVEGKKTFVEFQNLSVSEDVTVGQAFTIMCYIPRVDEIGLALQQIEPEQLDRTKTFNQDTGNEIRDGIEIDDFGKTAAIWVSRREQKHTRSFFDSERVPADRILHLMRQRRVRQTYGVSRLTSVINEMHHLKMYEEYTVIRARLEACMGVSIETEIGGPAGIANGLFAGGTGTGYTEDTNENPIFNFEPGMVNQLPAGKKANFHANQTPGNQFEPFTVRQTKNIAAGAGLDYPTVSRDYTGGSFTSQRQGQIELWDSTDPEQQRLINDWCQPIREEFIRIAFLEGRISVPGVFALEIPDELMLTDWQPKPKLWIDPKNQADAARIQIEQVLNTRERILNQQGEDFRETVLESSEEKKFAADNGVTFPENANDPAPVETEPEPEVVKPLQPTIVKRTGT